MQRYGASLDILVVIAFEGINETFIGNNEDLEAFRETDNHINSNRMQGYAFLVLKSLPPIFKLDPFIRLDNE